MLSNYRELLIKAATDLHALKSDPGRLDLVLLLQRSVLRRMFFEENRIRRINAGLVELKRKIGTSRASRDRTRSLKARINRSAELIDIARDAMFAWRCFGDGIAYIFQCKYALKQLYFGKDDRPKEGPGFVSNKVGLRREWKALRAGIRLGYPVVLADLTNVIRYGDVCWLAASDPIPVEIKSSRNRNARTERQSHQIRQVLSFYEKDWASELRSRRNVARIAQKTTEVSLADAINLCVSDALDFGHCIVVPEAGLRYAAFTSDEKIDEFAEGAGTTAICVLLSPTVEWLPSYPFALSLKPKNFTEFLCGSVAICVEIDVRHLKQLFLGRGWFATILLDNNYALQISRNPSDLTQGVFRVSRARFFRIASEFQSLAWFANEMVSFFESAIGEVSSRDIPFSDGDTQLVLDEWATATDPFD